MPSVLQTLYNVFMTALQGANEFYLALYVPIGELMGELGDGTIMGVIADFLGWLLQVSGLNMLHFSLMELILFGAVDFLLVYLLLSMAKAMLSAFNVTSGG